MTRLQDLEAFIFFTGIGKEKKNFCCQIKSGENKMALLRLVLKECLVDQPVSLKRRKVEVEVEGGKNEKC